MLPAKLKERWEFLSQKHFFFFFISWVSDLHVSTCYLPGWYCLPCRRRCADTMQTLRANLSTSPPPVSTCLWSPGCHDCSAGMRRPYRQLSVSHKAINPHLCHCQHWQGSARHNQSASCTEICHFSLARRTNRHLNLANVLWCYSTLDGTVLKQDETKRSSYVAFTESELITVIPIKFQKLCKK